MNIKGNSNVTVVGSANMDLMVKSDRLPFPGETIVGERFSTYIGGKGTNQAIAASRMGAMVHMVARVGQDDFGTTLLNKFAAENIDSKHVCIDTGTNTGIAVITVDRSGENHIIIIPQANGKLSENDIDQAKAVISNSSVLLLQMEVPVETSIHAARIARTNNTLVILNPAPATDLPKALVDLVDIIIPNETEAEYLTGIKINDEEDCKNAADILLERGISDVIITLGKQGAFIRTNDAFCIHPALHVDVVDTTAAGDAFCGALAASLAVGFDLTESVKYGVTAGSLAATKLGAEPSLPQYSDVKAYIKK